MFNLKKTNKNLKNRSVGQPNKVFDDEVGAPSRQHKPDYLLVIITLILLLIGLVTMYSIGPALAISQGVDQHYFVNKQLLAIGLGLTAFVIFSYVSLDFLARSRKKLIWLSLISIVAAVILSGPPGGADRWVQVGGLSFQVAELIKLSVIVWVAWFLVQRLKTSEIKSSKKTLYPLLILIGLAGVLVAGLQSDFGSAGVIVAITVVMAFSAGLPIKRLALIGAIVLVGATLSIVSTPYRQDRLATFLSPTSDCQNQGYQTCQALIAVGSGGMFGLGIGNSVQAYGYQPEAANDSIFAILGETFGFVGSTAIIGLFALLFSRMRRIIMHTSDSFSRLLVIGVLVWLGTQTIINVGAMIGLLPLKGITLPFISFGGTSMVFVMAAMGVVFKISKYTSFSPVRNVLLNKSGGNSRDNSISGRRQRRPHYATARSR